ncbi:DUF4159 domain-containing protein [Vulgatibacter incomptus]|uniref:Membrane protein, putative n=1 Tax=Vulgatibacter incomptus TaxID=1391653 RepID=A0A0K1PD42_9BACT|nr:DUF4159 domain-containing protein [Vulgatibacter incomptus]AKU91463.1 membrane protein, putative [Vulgatibacter incomptus]
MNERDVSRAPLARALLIALLIVAIPQGAAAFGETSRLVFVQGKYAGDWNPRPSALRRLAFEIGTRTSIATVPEEKALPLDSPEVFRHPFLYLAGKRELPPLSAAEVDNLRRYLTYGGFLLCDDAGDGRFAASCERELARILPGRTAGRIPAEHVLYKSFYLVNHPAGRTLASPYLSAYSEGSRLMAVVSANDLGGAWARDELGSWEYEVVPGGESQREIAFRLGVNIVMYSMCTDYKDDQVHLPFIMKRRR